MKCSFRKIPHNDAEGGSGYSPQNVTEQIHLESENEEEFRFLCGLASQIEDSFSKNKENVFFQFLTNAKNGALAKQDKKKFKIKILFEATRGYIQW